MKRGRRKSGKNERRLGKGRLSSRFFPALSLAIIFARTPLSQANVVTDDIMRQKVKDRGSSKYAWELK